MKIETPGGYFIHVDSIEELDAALKVLRAATEKPAGKLDLAAREVDEEQRVKLLFKNINANARKFLFELAPFTDGISGDKFEELSGFSSDTWGGMMGGIKKQAEAQSLKREKFVESEMRNVLAQRVRYLIPGTLLIKYRAELQELVPRKEREEKGGVISMGA